MATTGADILIETLIDWGVEVIFGLPGDGIDGIMESLRTHCDQLRFLQVRHEEAAAFRPVGRVPGHFRAGRHPSAQRAL